MSGTRDSLNGCSSRQVCENNLKDNRLILVFDSGLGGLTVYREIRMQLPDAATLYLADDAAFPYGRLEENVLIARVMDVLGAAIKEAAPDVVVIACNTASTLVLPPLRAKYPEIAFVGTVPAVKPAAERSQSHMITVLGTRGTVQRDYTRGLIRDHAAHCDVTLVGSEKLAALAEAHVHGHTISDEDLARELEPCFVEKNGKRTDHIVLACTHYPLLQERMEQLAGVKTGWPVTFVDPAAAIARRVAAVLAEKTPSAAMKHHDPRHRVWTTSGDIDERAGKLFTSFGLMPSPEFGKAFV